MRSYCVTAQDRDLVDHLAKLDEVPAPSDDEPTSEAARKQQQSNALEQLSGLPSTSPSTGSAKPAYSHPAAVAKRAEPISLAAFMGGNATGPRLRRHAPQQDASDPSQFEQRTKISAPHPVFGRGGIALPGLAKRSQTLPSQTDQPSSASPGSAINKDDRNVSEERGTTTSTPPLRASAEPRPYSPEKPRPTTHTWQATSRSANSTSVESLRSTTAPSYSRNTSSPAPIPGRPAVTSGAVSNGSSNARSQSPVKATGAPPRTMSSPSPSYPRPATSPSKQSSPVGRSREPAPALFLPKQHTSTAPPPSHAHVPSLARSVKPEPRHPSPKMPPSLNPSRAFTHSPTQKDPTPSLSRLKGRGFVQSMIKASSDLEVGSMPSLPSPVEKSAPGGKKVLERWQPGGASPSSQSPPVVAPRPKVTAMRKSTGFDEQPPLLSPVSERKKRASLPSPVKSEEDVSAADLMPPEGTPGLGSGSTLISYMKPPPKPSSSPSGSSRPLSPRIQQAVKSTPQVTSAKQLDPSKPLLHVRDRFNCSQWFLTCPNSLRRLEHASRRRTHLPRWTDQAKKAALLHRRRQ